MKKISVSLIALSLAATPLAAQQETPMQMAERVNACDGREVLSARMTEGDRLAVQCADASTTRVSSQGTEGGLGVAAPLIGLGVIAIGVAALAGGSSSSDTQ